MSFYTPDAAALKRRATEAEDWALTHGLLMRLPSSSPGVPGPVTHAPVTLQPTRFKKAAFEKAMDLAPTVAALMRGSRSDRAWLESIVRLAASADPFTEKLVGLCLDYWALPEDPQPIKLDITRADYLEHSPTSGDDERVILQVEVNTIAASFTALSALVSELHRNLMEQEAGAPVADACLPDNQASGDAAPLGIGAAHWAYIRQQRRHRATCSTTTCPTWAEKNVRVLFVVQPGERNTMDQRHIEYSLRGLQAGQYGDRIAASPETGAFIEGPVWSMRASLADIHREGTIDPATGALLFRGFEISVVYFRAGYSPNDYPTEAEWAARRLMNRSTAVECPDPAFHLAGLKKAQQVWCEAGVVERLLASSRSYVQADGSPDVAAATAAAQALRQVFALQHGLDSPEATAALERDAAKYAAAESLCDDGPGDYVLKPQREGGGNNAHGAGARTTAASLPPSEKPGWILMEKIAAPHRPSVFMRHCEVLPVSETICELGIYGVMLVDESTNQVFVNRPSGYLARTKPATSGEGGVASGFSCLDSVELI